MKLNFKLIFDATVWIVKKNIKTVLLVSLLSCAIFYLYTYSTTALSKPPGSNLTNAALNVVMSIVISILYSSFSLFVCYFLIILIVSHDVSPSTPISKQLHYIFGRFVPLYLTSAFYGVIVSVGSLFLIIPGVIFAIKYGQAVMFALVDGDNQSDAFQHSADATKGNYLRIIGATIFMSIVYFVSLLPIMMLPIPQFIKMFFYFFILFLGEIVNYVIWKILRQNLYIGKNSQHNTAPLIKKIYLVTLILFVTIMVGIAIKTLISSNNRFNNLIKSTSLPTSTPSPLPTPPSSTPATIDPKEIKGWKTYTNNKYGYSLQHPLEFVVQSLLTTEPDSSTSSNVAIRTIDGTKYITITVSSGTIDEAVSASKKSNGLDLLQTTDRIGHTIVVLGNDKVGATNLQTRAYIDINSKQYLEVRLGPTPKGEKVEYRKFFLEILSTITFKK